MWNQQWAINTAVLQPPLPNTTQVLPSQPPLPTAPPPSTAIPIAAASVVAPGVPITMASPYGQYTAAQYAALTAEQQYAIQQHWQQWQTYQQEYAKWHAQYGDQYNREIAAATAASYQQSLPSAPQPPPLAISNTAASIPAAKQFSGEATIYNNPSMQQMPPANAEVAKANNFNQISNNFSQAQPPTAPHQSQSTPAWQQKEHQQNPEQQPRQQQQQQLNQPYLQDFKNLNNNTGDNQRFDENPKIDENEFYIENQRNNGIFNNNNNNMNNNMNNRNMPPNMRGNNSFPDRNQNNFPVGNNDDNQARGWNNENNNERWPRNNENRNYNNKNNNNNNNRNNNPTRWGNSRNEGNFGMGQKDRNFNGNRNNNNNNYNNNDMNNRNNRNQGNWGNNFRQDPQTGPMNRPQQQNQHNQSFSHDRNINRQQSQFNNSFPQDRDINRQLSFSQSGNSKNFQQQQQHNYQQAQSMNRQYQENQSFPLDRGMNRQHQQIQSQKQQNQPAIPVEMTEEIFDRQFRQWEEQFEEWKRSNANSTDRKMYEYCAAQFENQRKRLIERRDQMRRRKMEQMQMQQNIQAPNDNMNMDEKPKILEQQIIVEKGTEAPVENENGLDDEKEEAPETAAVSITIGNKRTTNISESECSQPKSLKPENEEIPKEETPEDQIPIINLDDDENEEATEDKDEAQPMSGIFNKSGEIPGLDLVDDANTEKATNLNAEIPANVNFLSESKTEKPIEEKTALAAETTTTIENKPENNLLTRQIQESSVGNLPIVLEALRNPETLKNILQVLAKVKGLTQQEIGNTGEAPSEQVLQELPGLLQKLQDQRTSFANAENSNPRDTGNMSFAEWQSRKDQGENNHRFANNAAFVGENQDNFRNNCEFNGNFSRDANFNDQPNKNNAFNNAPYGYNRNSNDSGSNFNNRNDNFCAPNSSFGNRGPGGPRPEPFLNQNRSFGSSGSNFGRPIGGGNANFGGGNGNFGGPYSNSNDPQNDFEQNPMNIGPGNRSFKDDRTNTNLRGRNRMNPFRQNVGNRDLTDRAAQNFNANTAWKMGGRHHETDDDFYQPCKVIDYENTSTATKVFDYTRRTEKPNFSDEFMPMKTIDYGHSSGSMPIGGVRSLSPGNKVVGGNSFRGKKKNNRKRGGAKNKNNFNSNAGGVVAAATNEQKDTNSNELKQGVAVNAVTNQNEESNLQIDQNNDFKEEKAGEKEETIDNKVINEKEETKEKDETNEKADTNEKEAESEENTNLKENLADTELEQISDTEYNSSDRMDNSSPAPPPPPIFSLHKLPPIIPLSVDDTPLFPAVDNVRAQNKSKSHDSHAVQLLYPSVENKNTITIDEIILKPGRFSRPKKICIIMRGPPGSGKSYIAKLIKDKETEMGGDQIRLLSIDDYFMIENDYTEMCPKTGKKLIKKEILYEYDANSEDTYMQYLIKAFKKTVADNLYDFIIVDCNNNSLRTLNEFYCHAKDSGFVPYIIDLICDVETCLSRNAHERSEHDIRHIIDTWKPTPFHYIKLDVSSLLEVVIKMEHEENMEMDIENSENSQEAGKLSNSPINVKEESQEGESNCGFLKSKWETDLNQTEKLARLDGIRKSLCKKETTMEDYLQLEDWEPPSAPIANTGKKRVRWADIEEKRAQEKMREIGFVVGQTDWKRMMDPNAGNRALNKTKYI